MVRFLLLALALVAPRAFALSSEAAEAIHTFQECAPEASTACTKTATCTQAQFCSACAVVEKAASKECHAKAKAYSAAEAIFGYLQGSCGEICGAKRPGAVVTSQGHKAGDQITIVQNHAGKQALGLVVSNGELSFSNLYVGGEKKAPGTVLVAADDSVAPEVASAFSCVKTANNAFLTDCMAKPSKCNDKKLAKAGRCNICNAVKTCADGQAFVAEFFEISCAGC